MCMEFKIRVENLYLLYTVELLCNGQFWEPVFCGIRNNGISENHILNILLLFIASITF